MGFINSILKSTAKNRFAELLYGRPQLRTNHRTDSVVNIHHSDLAFALHFPTDPFETLWYWQPFGGYEESPFWNRTYNVGLEPTTTYPGDTSQQHKTGTVKTLKPGETVEAKFVAATYGGLSAVDAVTADGEVYGTEY